MRIVTILVVLLLLSGCSQLNDQSPETTASIDRTERPTTAVVETDRPGPTTTATRNGESTTTRLPETATTTEPLPEPTVTEPTTEPLPEPTVTEPTATPSEPTRTPETKTYSANDVDTEAVQLTLSELPDGLTIAGDTLERREAATGDRYNRMEENGVRLRHERAFSADREDLPAYVFASVMVYDARDNASTWLGDHLQQLKQNSGTVRERSVAASTTATEARFESDEGLQTVGLYQRHANVVFYVAVSGDEYDAETTERLFMSMFDDFDG